MPPFRRAFIEITNVCNLSCRFCAPAKRVPAFMCVEDFSRIAEQAVSLAPVVSLHILGEPLVHPQFREICGLCSKSGLKLNLVTNGILLEQCADRLFGEKALCQLSVSLHALESLPRAQRRSRLEAILSVIKNRPGHVVAALRLRGAPGGEFVRETEDIVLKAFPGARKSASGLTLADNVFFHRGEFFSWPGSGRGAGNKTCLGLKHHFGVLCTGEVLPCCMDYDAQLAVGNAFSLPLAQILSGEAAARLRRALSGRAPMPEFCAGCGFNPPSQRTLG